MALVNTATPEMCLVVEDMQKLFDEELPLALTRHVDEARAVGARFQLNVTGAGQWNVDLSPSGPACVRGVLPADCTVTIAEDDFRQLLARPYTMTPFLFLRGKLKLEGNRALAVKLNTLFSFK